MLEIIKNFINGMIMGAVELVPGFSAGTMAFILGFYQKLLDAIRAFDLEWLRLLRHKRFREATAHIDWAFLLPLLLGMILAIFSFANLTLSLLERWPGQVWSFFIGLIISAIICVFKDLDLKKPAPWFWLLLGFGVCVLLNLGGRFNLGHSLPIVFMSGFLAICALILPGTSGSFMLVLLNQYEYILGAVSSLNFVVLLTFCAGVLTGMLLFVRVVAWLLHHFHNSSMAALTGLMAGCILLIWPWRVNGSLSLPPDYGLSFALSLLLLGLGIALPLLAQHLAILKAKRQVELTTAKISK